MTTLRELIEELVELRDSLPEGASADEVDVLVAVQPTWALAHELDAVTLIHESGREKRKVLWLAASSGHPYDRSPYAPQCAWEGGEIYPEPEEGEDEHHEAVAPAGEPSSEEAADGIDAIAHATHAGIAGGFEEPQS